MGFYRCFIYMCKATLKVIQQKQLQLHYVGVAGWAYLVMVVGCVAAATTVTAADSSAGCRQSIGSLHWAARLLKGKGTNGLRCWVMDMVEVVGTAVAVTVDVLRATGLLRR